MRLSPVAPSPLPPSKKTMQRRHQLSRWHVSALRRVVCHGGTSHLFNPENSNEHL